MYRTFQMIPYFYVLPSLVPMRKELSIMHSSQMYLLVWSTDVNS